MSGPEASQFFIHFTLDLRFSSDIVSDSCCRLPAWWPLRSLSHCLVIVSCISTLPDHCVLHLSPIWPSRTFMFPSQMSSTAVHFVCHLLAWGRPSRHLWRRACWCNLTLVYLFSLPARATRHCLPVSLTGVSPSLHFSHWWLLVTIPCAISLSLLISLLCCLIFLSSLICQVLWGHLAYEASCRQTCPAVSVLLQMSVHWPQFY